MDPDFELLGAWQGGDAEAGNRLFQRHFESVAWFFRNKVADHFEDLIQETFLACVEVRERFHVDASFRAFILGVAHNVLRSYYRRRNRKDDKVDFGLTSVSDLAPSPSMLVARRGEHRLLLEALRRIPLEAQVILELYYWEALTGAELGLVLDVPEGTARTRLRRAKQLLEEAMTELAESPEQLKTTMGDLDAWARGIRDEVAPRSE